MGMTVKYCTAAPAKVNPHVLTCPLGMGLL
jgi:hypothetical protein